MKSVSLRKSAEKLLSKISGYWDIDSGKLSEDVYARLVNDIARLEKMDAYTLFQSCVSAIGKPRDRDEIIKLCYFIKANKDDLKQGKIVPMCVKAIPDGQHEMRVINAIRNGPDYITLELLVTTGPCAMMKTRLNGISINKAQIWLKNMGYSVFSKQFYPGSTALSFIGCYALFDYKAKRRPSANNPEGPIEVVYSEAIQKYNRQYIIKPRRGLSECPFGLTEKIARFQDYCWNWCLRGQCDCPASYHENNYVVGRCDICGNDKAPIDPELPGECQQCRRKRLGITDFD